MIADDVRRVCDVCGAAPNVLIVWEDGAAYCLLCADKRHTAPALLEHPAPAPRRILQ